MAFAAGKVAMEVFRNLHVSATAEQMTALVGDIEESLPDSWTRDLAAEGRAQPTLSGRRPLYFFGCRTEDRRAAALVILAQKDPGTFHVSNIIPTAKHQLARGEYNYVLEEFHERLLRPAADRSGLTVVLSDAVVGLAHWMSAAAAEKLHKFFVGANKGAGSSHQSDRERWNDFVLSAHQEGSSLDAVTLNRWLVEVEGWSPGVADQLAVEYEYGRELLAYAEGHRRSA